MAGLRVATFNAGLAVGMLPHCSERLELIVRALQRLDADLLFVQEFWLDTHWAELTRALGSQYAQAFRPAPSHAAQDGACSKDELAPLVTCARKHCEGLTSEALGSCVLRYCAGAASSMSTDCLNCVVRHPVGTLDEIVGPCLARGQAQSARGQGASPPTHERTSGRGPAGLMAYGGSFGTGLLSKAPLEDRDVLVFASTVNARGALYARVATPLAEFDVFAVHFSPGPESEQRPQVERFLRWIDERGVKRPTLVVGDLNMGSGSGLFRRFLDAGFDDPYARQPNAKCTFCGGGLTSSGHGTSGLFLDHVLVRGFRGAAAGARVLDETVTLIAGGSPVLTTLSDHCGVLVTLLS